MPANMGNSAVATGVEKVIFIPKTKKDNAKECSNYCTVALISHASKVMLKILQAKLQQYMNCELPGVQAGFRKGRGRWDQIANICWIIKKAKEFQKNIYFCFIDYAKPLTVWITTNCGKFWEKRILDYIMCLLRNLYAGQEATVRTGHGTTDWFQIGKGICQGFILSPCLFNLYAESIIHLIASWMKHKLESRLLVEISVTSDAQVTPPLWQNMKYN